MLALTFALLGSLHPDAFHVRITCDDTTIPMGATAVLRAEVTGAAGQPPAEPVQLLPFAGDKRWGHHAVTDPQGRAVFRIPMPRPGEHDLRVVARHTEAAGAERWIWLKEKQGAEGPVWFQRVVTLPADVESAEVWAAADDELRLFINGQDVVRKRGWRDNAAAPVPEGVLRPGDNVFSLWATNNGGPAGALLRIELRTSSGQDAIVTNEQWRAFAAEPPGWPAEAAEGGQTASLYGRADGNPARPSPWPGLEDVNPVYVDPRVTAPEGAPVSNAVTVTVENRQLVRPPKDPGHLVGAQWEPWFTPLNSWWQTAQAVPLLGFYNSADRDITRQHLIWLIESGADFVMADWSNHIWFSSSWSEIGPGSWEIIDATTAALDELAAMRAEGHDVPKFTLLTGISHVPAPDGPRAVNEQLAWIYENYVKNPKYAGLWQEFEGKPLVMPLNLGASYLKNNIELDDRFTIRYMGAGTDHNEEAQLGLWSWMDHAYPAAPMKDGAVESMTASVGSFGWQGGWLGDRARGRRNGATLVEDWIYVMRRRPLMVQLHQFNEFTGAREGAAHGPNKDLFYDSYSADLSDDFEPVALDQSAYRGEDGYGFYYLNLVRALVDLYREAPERSTVLAIQRPAAQRPGFSIKPVITGGSMELIWTWAGVRPETFTVTINGEPVLKGHAGTWADIDVSGFEPGELRVRVTGDGSQTRYPLLWKRAATRLDEPVEAYAEVICELRR